MRLNFGTQPVINITVGEHYVTKTCEEVLTTVLGSCISACVKDPINNVAGINHFLLPACEHDVHGKMRYGHHSMEVLINDMMKLGAERRNMVVKVFGGANVNHRFTNGIGSQNVDFIVNWAHNEGFVFEAEDLGGTIARRIYFNTLTGKVNRQLVGHHTAEEVFHVERNTPTPKYGDIELFD